MAEESINEVIERVQARIENSQHAVGLAMIDTEDALTLMAKISALQGVIGRVLELANDGKTYETLMGKDMAFNAIKNVIGTYAALNTPTAESEADNG